MNLWDTIYSCMKHIIIAYHTHPLLATCSDSYCKLFTWVLHGGAVWTHGQQKLCWVSKL